MLLERQQRQALRNIFGEGLSARKMRERASLQLLHTRRVNVCYKFANKCRSSEKFQCWFPEREASRYGRRSGVLYNKYEEMPARTERFRNGPINYMQRLMNER